MAVPSTLEYELPSLCPGTVYHIFPCTAHSPPIACQKIYPVKFESESESPHPHIARTLSFTVTGGNWRRKYWDGEGIGHHRTGEGLTRTGWDRSLISMQTSTTSHDSLKCTGYLFLCRNVVRAL